MSRKPAVGVVLGGGGETGVAWQTGVLAALGNEAGLTPDVVDVVVGTSAGALSGACFSSGSDLNELVERERQGKGVSAPVPASDDGLPIPADVIVAMNAKEGPIEERNRKVGALAMKAEHPLASADFAGYVGTMLPVQDWPALDFRATAVNARTGRTVIWRGADGVPLATAVASSIAVPGFLPTVEIEGEWYIDAPRASFSAGLVEEKGLDAVIYIGMPTPTLSNTVEEAALTELERGGLKVVRITGGEGSEQIIARALDPKIRPFAVETGLRDGAAAAQAVAAVLKP